MLGKATNCTTKRRFEYFSEPYVALMPADHLISRFILKTKDFILTPKGDSLELMATVSGLGTFLESVDKVCSEIAKSDLRVSLTHHSRICGLGSHQRHVSMFFLVSLLLLAL